VCEIPKQPFEDPPLATINLFFVPSWLAPI